MMEQVPLIYIGNCIKIMVENYVARKNQFDEKRICWIYIDSGNVGLHVDK